MGRDCCRCSTPLLCLHRVLQRTRTTSQAQGSTFASQRHSPATVPSDNIHTTSRGVRYVRDSHHQLPLLYQRCAPFWGLRNCLWPHTGEPGHSHKRGPGNVYTGQTESSATPPIRRTDDDCETPEQARWSRDITLEQAHHEAVSSEAVFTNEHNHQLHF